MFASGVLSSCVTDDTNRERISASLTPLSTARCASIRLTPHRITAKPVATNVVSARREAESSIGSRDALTRSFHSACPMSSGTSDAVSDESMKRRGKARSAIGKPLLFEPLISLSLIKSLKNGHKQRNACGDQ